MKTFDEKNLQKMRVTAPEGMFNRVQERIIKERLREIKTQRHLLVGIFLLLIVAGLNIGMLLSDRSEKNLTVHENKERILYKTYFDNTISLADEK
jgi:hypothetical protein